MEGDKKEGELVVRQPNKVVVQKYGDGVAWLRGAMIGKGSFGSVYLARLKKPRSRYRCLPPVMAVKSAEVSVSGSIQKEREVLSNVKGCVNVIKSYGDETTRGVNGEMVYNLLLEYGSGGTLADLIKKSGETGLAEFDARRYTRSMLRGILHIHDCGYVHCDLKPDNILLVPNGENEFIAKIGDLGLAKRVKQSKKRKIGPYWRGTPMYLSPEVVADGVQEPPSDIWALGCIVLEMLTGKPPWCEKEHLDAEGLLNEIGEGRGLPEVPNEVSSEARSFLKGCFVRKAMFRLTAEMLLCHPFVEGLVDDEEVEALEDVSDVNAVSSLVLLSDSDDELSCSSFSEDWSDNEYLSSWSEDDAEEMDDGAASSFSEESTVEVQGISRAPKRTKYDAGFDHVMKTAMQVPPQVPSTATRQYPITFTIPAGV
ncbi:hypothetical protein RJ640_021391 [Escallonia rubra]|uniref:Protein kinase domain-containing protein n=1 Tax=Escallonia rubra TaxID=112253 RepID=A0AA88RVI6_9ASTE|nr:hypothetical protein RJ640_021391 [Escallonia rubra]